MRSLRSKYLWVLPSISLVLLAIPMLLRQAAWLSLIALIPFVYYSQNCVKVTAKDVERAIFYPGILFGLISFTWILQTSPSSWTALEGSLALISKLVVWAVTALLVSGGYWLLGKYVAKFRNRPELLLWSLPVSELLRVYSFSVVYYGPGGSLSPNWNVSLAGLPLMATPFSYISRFVGLYGMSMVAVSINTALYLILTKKRRRLALAILGGVVALSVIGSILYQPNGQKLSVAAVHLGSRESLENWPRRAVPARDTDLLVLPEYSLIFQSKQAQEVARNDLGKQTVLITSVATKDIPSRNVLTLYQPQRGIFNQQSKTFLIAGGEYMPYIVTGIYKVIKQDYLIQAFNVSQQVRRGEHNEVPVDTGKFKVGSLVCSGVVALSEYRRLTSEGSEILTNPASLSLIANASLYHQQESYLTKFHAVSNARPFVQASRSGESYILNSNGYPLAKTKGNTGLIAAEVSNTATTEIYTLIGEWTLLVGPLLLVIFRRQLR